MLFSTSVEEYFQVLEGEKTLKKWRWRGMAPDDRKVHQEEYVVEQLAIIGGADIEERFLKILELKLYSTNIRRIILRELPDFCSRSGIEAIFSNCKAEYGDVGRMAVASLGKLFSQRELDDQFEDRAQELLLSVLIDERKEWSSEEYEVAAEALKDVQSPEIDFIFAAIPELDQSDIACEALQNIKNYRSRRS